RDIWPGRGLRYRRRRSLGIRSIGLQVAGPLFLELAAFCIGGEPAARPRFPPERTPAMKDKRPILTTRQGHPVAENQALRSVGERGPATLENYHFIEKITHFDRERIPERVVHARGTGAHGWFEAYGKIGDEPAGKYTRAKVLTETGVRTP